MRDGPASALVATAAAVDVPSARGVDRDATVGVRPSSGGHVLYFYVVGGQMKISLSSAQICYRHRSGPSESDRRPNWARHAPGMQHFQKYDSEFGPNRAKGRVPMRIPT